MNIPCSQVNSRQVERPNKAYQIAEPDNRAARVEWLSDTVEKAMRGIPGANEDQIILDQADLIWSRGMSDPERARPDYKWLSLNANGGPCRSQSPASGWRRRARRTHLPFNSFPTRIRRISQS